MKEHGCTVGVGTQFCKVTRAVDPSVFWMRGKLLVGNFGLFRYPSASCGPATQSSPRFQNALIAIYLQDHMSPASGHTNATALSPASHHWRDTMLVSVGPRCSPSFGRLSTPQRSPDNASARVDNSSNGIGIPLGSPRVLIKTEFPGTSHPFGRRIGTRSKADGRCVRTTSTPRRSMPYISSNEASKAALAALLTGRDRPQPGLWQPQMMSRSHDGTDDSLGHSRRP